MELQGFEFDDGNRRHLWRREIDDNLVIEVFLGKPVFAKNQPSPTRSGSHLMIGPSATGRCWTIVLVEVDHDKGVWRPITGWPSTQKEIRQWRERD